MLPSPGLLPLASLQKAHAGRAQKRRAGLPQGRALRESEPTSQAEQHTDVEQCRTVRACNNGTFKVQALAKCRAACTAGKKVGAQPAGHAQEHAKEALQRPACGALSAVKRT